MSPEQVLHAAALSAALRNQGDGAPVRDILRR